MKTKLIVASLLASFGLYSYASNDNIRLEYLKKADQEYLYSNIIDSAITFKDISTSWTPTGEQIITCVIESKYVYAIHSNNVEARIESPSKIFKLKGKQKDYGYGEISKIIYYTVDDEYYVEFDDGKKLRATPIKIDVALKN